MGMPGARLLPGVGWVCSEGGYAEGGYVWRWVYAGDGYVEGAGCVHTYSWQAVGMHPTGMFSCLVVDLA